MESSSGYKAEFGGRATFRSAAFLILKKDGKTLLSKRINTSHEEGNYGLVSGHVEEGETAAEAIIREAKEEADITVKPQDLHFANLLQYNKPGDYAYLNVFFTADKWEGEITNREPDKCGELAWFPVDALPANTIEYIRLVLQNVEKGILYSTFS